MLEYVVLWIESMHVDQTSMRGSVRYGISAALWLSLFSVINYAAAEPSRVQATMNMVSSTARSQPARVGRPCEAQRLPRLVGTVVTSDAKVATLVPDGTTPGMWVVAGEGESIGNLLILEISPGQVVLRGPEGKAFLRIGSAVEEAEPVQAPRIVPSSASWARTPGTRGYRS